MKKRIRTDSLKTGLVILQTVNIKQVPAKCAIDLIQDLLTAHAEIEELKNNLTNHSSIW